MTRLPNTELRLFTRFLYLAGIELILAGAWTLAVALAQGLRTTTVLAIAVMVVGAVCLAAPFFLKSRAALIAGIVSALGGGYGQVGTLAIPVLLSAFLFLRNPGIDLLRVFGPSLTSIWLIGLETLFFFQPSRETRPEQTIASRLPILSILLGYGILLIPSRVSSLFDGFPWNTPLEFITANFLLPFAFFFGRSFLSKRAVTALLALIFFARLTLGLFLPQSGLGVQAYFSEEALSSGKWERTYGSFLAPSYSQVMQLPYRSFYLLPIESINRHGFDKGAFWLGIDFNGAISLKEDERLVVLLQGTSERQIELTELQTGDRFEVATAKTADDLDADMFGDLPYIGNAELKGSLLFTSYGNGHFEPVILSPDGSVHSALPQIWLSPSALDYPVTGFQFIQNLAALLFAGVLLFGLFYGLSALYWAGLIDSIDHYLALTGFIFYYVTDVSDKPGIHSLFIAIAVMLAVVKLLDFTLRSRTYSSTGYIFSVGFPILLMFLPLDVHNLQSVIPIPQYQDAMEYQMLARNIYVAGDAFLLQTPPWAYKVLFPYIAGLLHILFGQSLSAQFFLNAWSAVLSVVLMVELGAYFDLPRRYAFAASSLFFILTLLPVSFTYFYRFGLIEPVAIMTLLLGAYYAKEGRYGVMFTIGIITGMLRLNFAGAIFTVVTFLAPAIVGGFDQAWSFFAGWCRRSWKRLFIYLVAIPLPSLLIAFVYKRFHPAYKLTHEMNDQTTIGSVLTSLVSVIVGGDPEFLHDQIRRNPQDIVLITLPILLGLLIAIISLVYRKGIFARLDLRLSLFLLSMLPVYAVLKPIGYFPRYSWSFLPPALILLGLVFHFTFLRDNSTQ